MARDEHGGFWWDAQGYLVADKELGKPIWTRVGRQERG